MSVAACQLEQSVQCTWSRQIEEPDTRWSTGVLSEITS